MEPKKHPIRHLQSWRSLYFICALVILLALLYLALEWKTPFNDGGYDIGEPMEEEQHHTDSSVILKTRAIKKDTSLN